MWLLKAIIFILVLSVCSCTSHHKIVLAENIAQEKQVSGTQFYASIKNTNWQDRDSLAVHAIVQGNTPDFLKKFKQVKSVSIDSTGKKHTALFFVAPDYLSVGTNNDFMRIPITPMAAQKIADRYNCFLPTKKLVDIIYEQADVLIEPMPMYIFRDSSVTMWQHHLMIEGQRKRRKGLIAGIKKDVVISDKISRDSKPNRVAIYGWHQLNGKPIQPLYTGHVNWYVDYSHGIRLVYRKVIVDGKEMDYTELMNKRLLQSLICDEPYCDFFRY